MPKVPINIIKEWFRNTMKPPEAQFWAWLDSFWHKDEEIPQSAVQNLVRDLQHKADLVDGVVPEEQLPFSVVTSEVIALGAVTIVDDKVNLAVHSSGANKVRVKGKTITRTFPNQWTFTPIENNGVKVLRGYAVKWEDDFFLAEGPELPEYQQPEIPPDALELFEFTVTSAGATIVQQDLTAYKLKANDAWVRVVVNYTTDVQTLSIHHAALRFIVTAGHDGVKIGGFRFHKTEFLYDGVPITLRNGTLGDLELATVSASSNLYPINPEDLPLKLKVNESCTLAYDATAGVFNVIKAGGGASFPELGNNGDVLVKDSASEDGVVWSNRLTTAEAELDAEIVNRALADANLQSQINVETATRSNVVDRFLHFWNATLGKWVSSIIYQHSNGNIGVDTTNPTQKLEVNGSVKSDTIILNNTTQNSIPNKFWTDGVGIYRTNANGINAKIAVGSVFVYTPTDNFTLSAVKTALEATGMIFNDSHIIINIGANNYTCSIDIGATAINSLITIGKRGAGTISFNSNRTLYTGANAVTIMNGNEASIAKLEFGTTTDFLIIRNI